MTEIAWPKENPSADRLTMTMLNRVSPGWAMRMGEANVSPAEAVDLLWEWNPLFQGCPECRPTAFDVEEADDAVERLALGETGVFASLSPAALFTLKQRHLIALSGATSRIVTGDADPVMRLPHGLTREERQMALTVRFLFRTDTKL